MSDSKHDLETEETEDAYPPGAGSRKPRARVRGKRSKPRSKHSDDNEEPRNDEASVNGFFERAYAKLEQPTGVDSMPDVLKRIFADSSSLVKDAPDAFAKRFTDIAYADEVVRAVKYGALRRIHAVVDNKQKVVYYYFVDNANTVAANHVPLPWLFAPRTPQHDTKTKAPTTDAPVPQRVLPLDDVPDEQMPHAHELKDCSTAQLASALYVVRVVADELALDKPGSSAQFTFEYLPTDDAASKFLGTGAPDLLFDDILAGDMKLALNGAAAAAATVAMPSHAEAEMQIQSHAIDTKTATAMTNSCSTDTKTQRASKATTTTTAGTTNGQVTRKQWLQTHVLQDPTYRNVLLGICASRDPLLNLPKDVHLDVGRAVLLYKGQPEALSFSSTFVPLIGAMPRGMRVPVRVAALEIGVLDIWFHPACVVRTVMDMDDGSPVNVFVSWSDLLRAIGASVQRLMPLHGLLTTAAS
jgi:hypothetical protein